MKTQRQGFDAFRLAASGATLEGRIELSTLDRLCDRIVEGETGSGNAATAGRQVRWAIRGAQDEQGRPALWVMIEGEIPLQCQRCLCPLEQPVEQSTLLLLARNDADLVLLDGVSEHEVILASAALDPAQLVEDELLLTLPFAPRHEASCSTAAEITHR